MTPDEMLEQRTVRRAQLAMFAFASETKRIWLGRGPLLVDGQIYEGAGRAVSIAGLGNSPGMDARPIMVTLSGVDPANILLARDQDEWKGRPFRTWDCLFDEDLRPVLPLLYRGGGFMSKVSVSMPDAASRTVALTVESWWADRGQAAHGMLTEVDQRARFPDDHGMQYQSSVAISAYAMWPVLDE